MTGYGYTGILLICLYQMNGHCRVMQVLAVRLVQGGGSDRGGSGLFACRLHQLFAVDRLKS